MVENGPDIGGNPIVAGETVSSEFWPIKVGPPILGTPLYRDIYCILLVAAAMLYRGINSSNNCCCTCKCGVDNEYWQHTNEER